MIIPIGVDRTFRRPTLVNHVLIATNVAAFAVTLLASQRGGGGMGRGAMPAWAEALVLTPGQSPWWTLLSYAWLHGSFMHLLGNMLTLWVFGPSIEDRLGRLGYLAFYLAGAVGAGLLHAAFEPNPVIGASGAIAAVTGAFLVLFPWSQVKVFLFFILIGVFQIPAMWFIGTRIAYDFVLQGVGAGGGVARLAHLGGYAFGCATAFLLIWTRLVPRDPSDLFSRARQAVRRREFLAAQHELARKDRGPLAKKDDPWVEALAAARAAVNDALASGDAGALRSSYRALLNDFGADPSLTLLHRRSQYDLANALYRAGDAQAAFAAYDAFARGYPSDPELPAVRLMLGLIAARALNDPVRAKQELNAALPGLPEGPERELARSILEDLGERPAATL